MEQLFGPLFGLLLVAFIVFIVVTIQNCNKRHANDPQTKTETSEEIQDRYDTRWYGPVNPLIVCPHCQEKGSVRIKYKRQKKGISGAKATGAVLTGGWSLLATGLSKKEVVTQAHCGHCKVTWHF